MFATTKATSVYVIPTTGAKIMAETVANMKGEFPELVAAIEAGTPKVRVEATTDGYRNCRAHIVAGVQTESDGFIHAHLTGTDIDDNRFAPRIEFRAKDGRLDPAANAQKVLARFFAFTDKTPIEWVSFGY